MRRALTLMAGGYQMVEIANHRQAGSLAFFGMKLCAPNVLVFHTGGHSVAVFGESLHMSLCFSTKLETVHEVETGVCPQSFAQTVILLLEPDIVPSHVRDGQVRLTGGQWSNFTRDPVQSGRSSVLEAGGGQQLHAEADAKVGFLLVEDFLVQGLQPTLLNDSLGCIRERAHAGQDQSGTSRKVFRVLARTVIRPDCV